MKGQNKMSMNQPSHLYTIWRYDHNPDTIIDHKEILGDQGPVKWLVLYSDKDKKNFEQSLSKDRITKINDQITENVETVLYIQCLELFRSQIYAGLIKNIDFKPHRKIIKDKYVPKYYELLLKDPNLNVLCSISLSKLFPIDAEEIFNLIPQKIDIPIKQSYNLTRIVYQDDIHEIFSNKSNIKVFKNVQRRKERTRALAKLFWSLIPNIPIAKMADFAEIINIGCEGEIYGEKVMRQWIKDLCPDPKPGRPPKEIKFSHSFIKSYKKLINY